MGEAKRRGTFEHRKSEAIKKKNSVRKVIDKIKKLLFK